jgi:6-phosphogluconolactonase
MEVKVLKDLSEINRAAADIFVAAAQKAISEKGQFTVALTGGSSPVELHKMLAQEPNSGQVDWEKCFVFWGDERWVPLDDERSNARMAFKTLLNHVPVPKEQIFPMWSEEKTPEEYAAEYEKQLQLVLGERGVFDLIFLGMGDDGHTASLFPRTEVLKEDAAWVKAYYLDPQQMYRITLTAPLINRAKEIVFLVNGEKKAPALREVLGGERNPTQYPAQLISPKDGAVSWLVDQTAASKLENFY